MQRTGTSAADYRRHRVADILHPLSQAMGLDPREAGVTKIELDEASVPLVIELPPDGNYLIWDLRGLVRRIYC